MRSSATRDNRGPVRHAASLCAEILITHAWHCRSTQHNLIKLGNIASGYRIGATRGIGKPFMCFAVERAMALLARRLELDPDELRVRNDVTADEMSYTTPTGSQYDSGDWPATLRRARALRVSGPARRGRRAVSGSADAATVRVEPGGQIPASIGDPASGQGYETVIAQIVAADLGLTPSLIHVEHGFDSGTTPWLYLSGNYSNKFSVTDGRAPSSAPRARSATSSCASPTIGWK